MVDNDNYCLRLNSFGGKVKKCWQELQKEQEFCDVILACEDRQFKTHKVVISSCSPVLKNILQINHNPNTVIYLTQVTHNNLQSLLTFMYQGEVDVAETELSNFLEVAEYLNIRGLSEGNQAHINAEKEIKLKYESIAPSTKRIKSTEGIKTDNSVDVFKEHKEAHEKLTSNDNDINGLCGPIESQIKIAKQNNKSKSLVVKTENQIQYINSGEQYPCNKCSYKTTRKDNLKKHLASIHEGECHPCDQCKYEATEQGALKKHISSIHEGKRYPCDQCDYKATQKGSLKHHVASIHNGERYLCDKCEYKATFKTSLHSHIQSVHLRVQFLCSKCNYIATRKDNLKEHVASIHNGKQYLCEQCDFKTTTNRNLRSHQLKNHYS